MSISSCRRESTGLLCGKKRKQIAVPSAGIMSLQNPTAKSWIRAINILRTGASQGFITTAPEDAIIFRVWFGTGFIGDRHMFLDKNSCSLLLQKEENNFRAAISPLIRLIERFQGMVSQQSFRHWKLHIFQMRRQEHHEEVHLISKSLIARKIFRRSKSQISLNLAMVIYFYIFKQAPFTPVFLVSTLPCNS